MTAASNYLEEKTLNHILQNVAESGAAYTAPSNVYVSLHTGSPEEDDSGANEITGNDYARTEVTFGNVSVAANVCSVSSNIAVTFPQANGAYSANVTHIGVYDASTSGNLMFYGELSAQKQVTDGDVFQINSGSLTITLD